LNPGPSSLSDVDAALVMEWSVWLRQIGASVPVATERRQRVTRFARSIEGGRALLTAEPGDVDVFLAADTRGDRRRWYTLSRALIDFYRWAVEQDLVDQAPLSTAPRPRDRGWLYRDTAETAVLLEGFQIAQERRHLADGTIASRRAELRMFTDRLAPRSILYATSEELERWLDTRQLGARARYRSLSLLHVFYEWAIYAGHCTADPTRGVARPRLPRLVPRPIRDDELAAAIRQAPPDIRAWLTLAAFAGLRCAEIAGLSTEDVLDDREPGMLLVRHGKGDKDRVLPLHPDISEAIRALGRRRTGPLFVSPTGRQLAPHEISTQGSRYLHEIGSAATMHKLRHWFGTRLYGSTLDLRLVQEMLGHSSPTTTAGYAAYNPGSAVTAVLALEVGR
jgi:integrase/recombinase XerC